MVKLSTLFWYMGIVSITVAVFIAKGIAPALGIFGVMCLITAFGHALEGIDFEQLDE